MTKKKALQLIKQSGGLIRTAEALRAGVHPRDLYALHESGDLERLSRGLFRVSSLEPLPYPDLTTVALRIPRCVVCLVSALAFHGMTTQIPHRVSIALPKGSTSPMLEFPPLTIHRFSPAIFEAGIETHPLNGVFLRVYSRERTLADCFRYRQRIGMDVVIEALRAYREAGRIAVPALLLYARTCRVEKTMRPYLEAML